MAKSLFDKTFEEMLDRHVEYHRGCVETARAGAVFPFSYFWICWKVSPTAWPSAWSGSCPAKRAVAGCANRHERRSDRWARNGFRPAMTVCRFSQRVNYHPLQSGPARPAFAIASPWQEAPSGRRHPAQPVAGRLCCASSWLPERGNVHVVTRHTRCPRCRPCRQSRPGGGVRAAGSAAPGPPPPSTSRRAACRARSAPPAQQQRDPVRIERGGAVAKARHCRRSPFASRAAPSFRDGPPPRVEAVHGGGELQD